MEREASGINNHFYDTLGDQWHQGCNHPIALLRAENELRNPFIEQLIQKKWGKKSIFLDIGCGGGLLTNFMAKQGHETHGIDLSEPSLEVARRQDTTGSVRYLQANAYALPYPESAFDVVCAMDIIEHVEQPQQLIKEAARVLKPGGLFIFHTFSRNFFSWLILVKGVEWIVRNTPPKMHVYSLLVNPEEIEAFCQTHGLKVEKFIGVRPDFGCKAFWKTVFTRIVDPGFRFQFTSSLKTGYFGYAKKKTDNE